MITFNNIVERFEDFATSHFFIKSFSFGSPDDVDLAKFTEFPLMHLVYTGATYDKGTKTYNIEVYILDVPADKTAKVERQKEVVSDAEQCAEDIIADIRMGGNIFTFAQDYEVITASTTPLEEETKNVLSGVLLDLSVAIPYEWDACNAPIDGVSPEGGDTPAYARRGFLRMLTQDGSTDVLSVRTIQVSNGTLTDNGDGVVTLDTAGAESIDELTDVTITSLTPSQFLQYNGISGFWENETLYFATLADTKGTPTEGQFVKYTGGFWQPTDIELNDLDGVTITSPNTGNVLQYSSTFGWYNTNLPTPSPPPSTTDALPEGSVNLYYTEARVSANTDVSANTAKVGITAQQAADILNNNAKVGLITGGTTGQALVKSTGTDYDVEWADIAVDVQYHNRFESDAETFRSGATDTVELYYTAKADGDGLAESASSDTPTAGKIIKRKIYYSEAAFADPDTGTWVEFTPAPADDASFATVKAALLEYLKARTGGTVPISLKQTWEEVTAAPAFTGLLNETYGSGAEAAYSTRRLNGNVTDCMVIRRASDSTTTTIGFVDGDIDEAAIETFCTGTTCTVYQWLDQSGNDNTATAPSTGEEPTIYTGGALVKENGKVAVSFDGSNDNFISTYALNESASSYHGFVTTNAASGSGSFQTVLQGGRGHLSYDSNDTLGTNIGQAGLQSSMVMIGVRHLVEYLWNNSTGNLQLFSDGNSVAQTTETADRTATDMNIGSQSGSTGATEMNCQEIILYDFDNSSNRTDIEENVGDYFTQNTPLLDTYTGAAAAYSLRRLSSSYVGSAIEVYNGTSYADIGFNVFNELDTVALAAHCGSNDGFVSKWYDQSGNTNDAAQTTTGNMPKIYDGTTGVVTENGKPAVEFASNGSNGLNLSSTITGVASVMQILTPSSTASYRFVLGSGNVYHGGLSGTWIMNPALYPFASPAVYNGDNYLNSTLTNITTAVKVIGTQYLLEMYHDGTTSVNTISSQSSTSVTRSWGGSMQEVILYTSDQSSNRTDIEDNINTFYSIY